MRFAKIRQCSGNNDPQDRFEFWFVSNRPVAPAFLEAVEDAGNGALPRHAGDFQKLKHFTGLSGAELSAFCRQVRFEVGQDGLLAQKCVLSEELSGYLPGPDVDAPIQLKELVTRKATSEFATNPVIRKMDVLRALKTDLDGLFPAPCLIEQLPNAVPRAKEVDIINAIISAGAAPVAVHAVSGVGKSIFSRRINLGLPPGSHCVVYDCFGNGRYRSPSGYRHRHKDALVQVANELASEGLCYPLVPTPNVDHSSYMKAFLHRLKQSVALLRSRHADALLCIVIDAGDNAQIAANEIGEARSFVVDLLREHVDEGVRIVATCRTHRLAMLDLPPQAVTLELPPFSPEETAIHLRQSFPNATSHDVNEFHRLSSANPRVQSMALSSKKALSQVLRSLGPYPTDPERAFDSILAGAVANLRDAAGAIEKVKIDRICRGLATLRPLIPLAVLAKLSDVDESMVRSFALDLGRPIVFLGDTIQFFDEPSETWFRSKFKADQKDLTGFIGTLKPLASSSAYVASAIPQLMLEAGHFEDLVQMALYSQGLPEGSLLERRDVELQRLQFAIRASLRLKHYTDTAKLALKAGGESAGNERRVALLQSNTDLAAVFLDADRIQEIVSRRTFGSGWTGSHHAYDAGLMSGRPELSADSRSRLRMAEDWLLSWSRLPASQPEDEKISDRDRAEMMLGHLNVHGAIAAARFIRRWSPRSLSFAAGRIVSKRLIDHGRFRELDDLATAARNDLCLILAIATELRTVKRNPPFPVVRRAMRLLANPRIRLPPLDDLASDHIGLEAVTALVEASHKLAVNDVGILAGILSRYLPDSPPRSFSRYGRARFVLLRAYALRAALKSEPLELVDLAHPTLRTELNARSNSQEVLEFKEDIGVLLPWHQLRSGVILGRTVPSEIPKSIAAARSASASASISHQERSFTADEIAILWLEIIIGSEAVDNEQTKALNDWIASPRRPLYIPTLIRLARLAATTERTRSLALTYARRAFEIVRTEKSEAGEKASDCVELSRVLLTIFPPEARAYFDQAVAIAEKIGDENLDRWAAIVQLASHASRPDRPVPRIAYDFARCAELTYQYVVRDKHFDWGGTVRALVGLCPASSLAILSRWRDRDFGSAKRLLTDAVNLLVERSVLDSRDALALTAFRASWNAAEILKGALDTCSRADEKRIAAFYLYGYMVLSDRSAQTWRELQTVLAGHSLDLPGVDAQICLQEQKRSRNNPLGAHDSGPAQDSSKDDRDWESIFASLDLTKAEDIARAYQRLIDSGPPYCHESFFQEAFRRVPIGREADFIVGLDRIPAFDLYVCRVFLEQLPAEWLGRLSVQPALASTVKSFVRRHCMAITANRYYDILPLDLAAKATGLPKRELMETVFSALAESTEALETRRLFTLVGLISTQLSADEALEALRFSLSLFDAVLDEQDGDGPWSTTFTPPADIESAVAGYVWAALAAPGMALRWEAAHVVRGLCLLGRERVIDSLISLAKQSKGGPFVDARLRFYDLHARQWMLIALARATKYCPQVLAPYADFFTQSALNGEPHVLIREFAAKIVLALADAGGVNLSPTISHRLQTINESPIPVIVSDSHERFRHQESAESHTSEVDDLTFGMDAERDWFGPLGSCFAKSQREIERLARRVIKVDWRYPEENLWDGDAREHKRTYREGDTHSSHRSYPRADNLGSYMTYHATMIAAGRLLAEAPVHRSPDNAVDDFTGWLNRRGLSRSDGNWLSDRRDPAPLEYPAWKHAQIGIWRWSLERSDFDRCLVTSFGRINVWGDWTGVSGDRQEDVSIRSALVSRSRSDSLLRALQTCNPYDYHLPEAGHDLEIDQGEFRLKGWIERRDHTDSGLDRCDPWAGDISYPPISPAQFVTDKMNLEADSERRTWSLSSCPSSVIALWSELWGTFQERDSESDGERGARLQASHQFMTDLLRSFDMDLIIKVELHRRVQHAYYERGQEHDIGYVPSSARLFLARADGGLSTV